VSLTHVKIQIYILGACLPGPGLLFHARNVSPLSGANRNRVRALFAFIVVSHSHESLSPSDSFGDEAVDKHHFDQKYHRDSSQGLEGGQSDTDKMSKSEIEQKETI
jgi:hypothetical protein